MKFSVRTWVLGLLGIGVLAGLMFPKPSCQPMPSGRTHAENTAYNLKNAIAAYLTEYREYPLPDPTKDMTTGSGHALMDILLGAEPHKVPGGRNPRGIAFYTDKEAKPIGGGRYRKGLTYHPDDGTGELWDPWGNRYRVRFDTDSDKQIENPEAPGTFLPETIAVWSAGPDGDFDTWKDNVKTW